MQGITHSQSFSIKEQIYENKKNIQKKRYNSYARSII
jgi:hypothetical protein